ncbi:MAG: hypothetical protein Q7J98_02595, partial [Kiritimatiellia bacterium]|nr:hypothetical protein [Kiritimatiellia bacterium]
NCPHTFKFFCGVKTVMGTAQERIYRIEVVIDYKDKPRKKSEVKKAVLEIPVVKENINIHYWYAPKTQKYVTVTLCQDADIGYWRDRGVIPSRWAWGYAYGPHLKKDATESEIKEIYIKIWSSALSNYPSISIDEFGSSKPPLGVAMDSALVEVKKRFPKSFICPYIPGLNENSIKSFREAADLVLPERYFHSSVCYSGFNREWQSAQEGGIAGKTLFCLGLGNGWINTEGELLNQVRYIRKLAPEMKGIAFFSSTIEVIYQSMDKAVLDYYIKPVIFARKAANAQYSIKNIGGMDATDVKIEFYQGWPELGAEKKGEKIIKELKVNEEVTVPAPEGVNVVVPVTTEKHTGLW